MKNSLFQNFYRFVAQTSEEPLAIEIQNAKGSYFYDKNGKEYLDLISGISVSNLGHGNKLITRAIKNQADQYLHLMVYGELIQKPQVDLAELLCSQLPDELQSVFYVNSGSEAVEGALKLAKRATGRHEILYFQNAYHGATNGAMSVMGNEDYKKPFYPLLPETKAIKMGDVSELEMITNKTAAIIVELIQGEAGIRMAENDYWIKLRCKCDKTGTLLIVDEIQTGIGRTGKLFAFQFYNIIPDILLLAKAFGGGMPLGAFVASKELMHVFTHHPVLGHISTFGGHPVCCAAAFAHLKQIVKGRYWENAQQIGDELYQIFIQFPDVQEIRYKGAFMAVDFYHAKTNFKNLKNFLEVGLFSDWFLWYDGALRIAPPLIFDDKNMQDLRNRLNQLI